MRIAERRDRRSEEEGTQVRELAKEVSMVSRFRFSPPNTMFLSWATPSMTDKGRDNQRLVY